MLNEYLNTVNKLEPEISPVDRDAALTSIAISLKRIADHLEKVDYGEQIERGLVNGAGYAAEVVKHKF